MFHGNYNFFDYKHNIIGYTGQDYGGFGQYLYLVISLILITILLIILKKSSKEQINKIIRVLGVFFVIFYITKTTWESIYDIKLSGFNYYLLPFDSCSIIMWACLLAGFSKGEKIKNMASAWIATGGLVGGLAAMIFLNAFKYYPFFSFGAFYSMIWHFLMVFIGLLLIITGYIKMNYRNILYGFLFHLIISLIVIPIDFIFGFDFMMYKDLGGIPIFQDIASKLTSMHMQFLNPILMLILYFFAFNLIFVISWLIRKIILVSNNKNNK